MLMKSAAITWKGGASLQETFQKSIYHILFPFRRSLERIQIKQHSKSLKTFKFLYKNKFNLFYPLFKMNFLTKENYFLMNYQIFIPSN
jgi:hypothetical protein